MPNTSVLTKICTKCKEEKSLDYFGKQSMVKSGIRSSCKECRKKEHLENRDKILDKAKKWYQNNKSRKEQYDKKYRKLKFKERKIYFRSNYLKNKSRINSRNRVWYNNNKYKMIATSKRYKLSKLKRTPKYANLKKIEVFYWMASKISHILGIEYHVDHIIPLQGKTVSGFHHEGNLQVMRAVDNLRKSNSFKT